MTREDLIAWQRRMEHIILRHIETSYSINGFDGVADIDLRPLQTALEDALSDACGKAWAELDPFKWMNEPNDGTRSDDLYEERYLR